MLRPIPPTGWHIPSVGRVVPACGMVAGSRPSWLIKGTPFCSHATWPAKDPSGSIKRPWAVTVGCSLYKAIKALNAPLPPSLTCNSRWRGGKTLHKFAPCPKNYLSEKPLNRACFYPKIVCPQCCMPPFQVGLWHGFTCKPSGLKKWRCIGLCGSGRGAGAECDPFMEKTKICATILVPYNSRTAAIARAWRIEFASLIRRF